MLGDAMINLLQHVKLSIHHRHLLSAAALVPTAAVSSRTKAWKAATQGRCSRSQTAPKRASLAWTHPRAVLQMEGTWRQSNKMQREWVQEKPFCAESVVLEVSQKPSLCWSRVPSKTLPWLSSAPLQQHPVVCAPAGRHEAQVQSR